MSKPAAVRDEFQHSTADVNVKNQNALSPLMRQVVNGTVGAFTVRAGGAVMSLCMSLLLTHMLAISSYGVVALGLSWLAVSGIVACFGSNTVALRFVAEGLNRQDAVLVAGVVRWSGRVALSLGVLVAVVSVGLTWALFNAYAPNHLEALWIIIASTPLLAYALSRSGVLRGAKHVVVGEMVELLFRPVVVSVVAIIMYGFVSHSISVVQAAVVIVGAQAFSALVGWARSRSLFGGSRSAVRRAEVRRWWKIALPIAAMNIVSVLLMNVDTIMIGYFRGPEEAGIYRVAMSLSGLVAFGLSASNGIIASLVAELYSSTQLQQLRQVLRYSVTLVSLGSLGGMAVMVALGPTFLGFFGHGYVVGYDALLLLLASQAVNALSGPTGVVMSMIGRQRQAMNLSLASAAASISADVILIPHWGIVGGAIANIVGMAVFNLGAVTYLRLREGIDPSVAAWVRLESTEDQV